jgi:hypothetical protein
MNETRQDGEEGRTGQPRNAGPGKCNNVIPFDTEVLVSLQEGTQLWEFCRAFHGLAELCQGRRPLLLDVPFQRISICVCHILISRLRPCRRNCNVDRGYHTAYK